MQSSMVGAWRAQAWRAHQQQSADDVMTKRSTSSAVHAPPARAVSLHQLLTHLAIAFPLRSFASIAGCSPRNSLPVRSSFLKLIKSILLLRRAGAACSRHAGIGIKRWCNGANSFELISVFTRTLVQHYMDARCRPQPRCVGGRGGRRRLSWRRRCGPTWQLALACIMQLRSP